ncbi:response regulator [Aminomonas paucivorans]|uniref:Response regulator receiver protein n=1 Tax=Aminomonas paucivorans DSM 12260 TaxID=584708 RepID=E3CZ24_9BACT|nr:response regulator [Aminomonas paucivorans]EFQ22797.1 response regulator receiver protein [Aminomonas paucivorans DSM 12260]
MKRILVIEDDDSVRKLIRRILEGAGYTVLEAPDGVQGVQVYREQRPDLVLTDIFMPGKEGLETILELGLLDPEVRIIAVSGGGNMGILNPLPMAAKLGALRTLSKPFSGKELVDLVEEIFPRP